MRNSIHGVLLLACACWTAGVAAWGQDATKAKPKDSSLEVAVTYDAVLGNVTTGANFWMQGGSMQLHRRFWHGLGIVADVAGLHAGNLNQSGVGLDLVTATFGPRYTWSRAHSRYSVFGQALAGGGFGSNSTFPGSPSVLSRADSLATQLGGGVDFSLSHRLALRLLEAVWLRTQVTNATDNVQNSTRLGAGIVFRLP
jgi:hypothetical protein